MEWKKFFSDPATVVALFTSGVVGLLVGAINGIIQKRHGGWPAFFGAVATGAGVAIITGLALNEYVKSETLRLAIIGFCAVVSDDIWAGFRTLGGLFRKDPLDTVFRVWAAWRGAAPPPAPSAPAAIAPATKED
jgi:hypothetical protein